VSEPSPTDVDPGLLKDLIRTETDLQRFQQKCRKTVLCGFASGSAQTNCSRIGRKLGRMADAVNQTGPDRFLILV